MGVVWSANAGRPRVRRPSSPGGHLWWDRLRGALAGFLSRQRMGEGRLPARASFPLLFRRRSIEWSPLRAALAALARQP